MNRKRSLPGPLAGRRSSSWRIATTRARAGRERQRVGDGGADRARARVRLAGRRRRRPWARSTRSSSSRPTAAPSGGSAPPASRQTPSRTDVVAVVNLDSIGGRARPASRSAPTEPRSPAPVAASRPPRARSPSRPGRRPAQAERARPADRSRLPVQLLRAGAVRRARDPGDHAHDRRRPPAGLVRRHARSASTPYAARRRSAGPRRQLLGSLDDGARARARDGAATSTSARGSSAAGRSSSCCWRCCCRSWSSRSTCSRAAGGGRSHWCRRCAATAAARLLAVGGDRLRAVRAGRRLAGGAVRPLPPDATPADELAGGRADRARRPRRCSAGSSRGSASLRGGRSRPRRSSPATPLRCSRSAVVALLVVATNPFALLFLLPSLHVWLWLPQVRRRPLWTRLAVLAAGFARPVAPGRLVRDPLRPRPRHALVPRGADRDRLRSSAGPARSRSAGWRRPAS